MVWKEICVMDERMRFVTACLDGTESVSALSRLYGISRKTGYKWLDRYRRDGPSGLEDRSRAPHGNSRRVSDEMASEIISLRCRHRTWGPRKVKAWLEDRYPERVWPAASTIGALFDRVGLTVPRKRRRRIPLQSHPFAACRQANDLWCIDFKGWFLTGDGTQVDPLTLSDGHCRYLLRCQAVNRTDAQNVWPILESAFFEFGLPVALRSDNGPPFASRAAGGLSRLSVKLIKAGVCPDRIEPGKPQQNGRHERLHLTLKQETAAPPARSLREQIARFERFREIYNTERPHEALGQLPPARVYQPSPRPFSGILRSPDYADGVRVRRVRSNGEIKWRGNLVFVSEVLAGEPVGLVEIDNDCWKLNYGPVELGILKGEDGLQRQGTGRPSKPKPYLKQSP